MLSVDVTVRHAGGQAVVTLRGELDLASTPALATHLTAAAACGPSVIVDLAGLEYIGYSGLGVLVRIGKWLRAGGGDLSLAAPQPQVRKILVVTGLIDVFAVHPSVDAAAGGARPAHPLPAAARRPAAPDDRDRPALLATRDACGRRRVVRHPPRCDARWSWRRDLGSCRQGD
jgi:anti-sigma B factor antagonist